MTAAALITSIVLAASALMLAYAFGALWLPAAAILISGLLWIVGQRLGWRWVALPMVGLFVVVAAVGAWLDLSPVLLLVGLIAALSAWHLDGFARQLQRVDAVERERALQRRHLRRLLLVDGLGLLLAVPALTLQINLNFGLALVLGLIAFLGLSRAVGFLWREVG
jgi:hypothetical protein